MAFVSTFKLKYVWCVAWTEYHRYISTCVDTQNKSTTRYTSVAYSFLQVDTNILLLICMKYFQSKTHRHPQLVTMPVCKAEAHRALELLEDYYTRLDAETDERQLRAAIERVIRIFKSRLFQALLDIQEFYELTLMDETKSTNVKTAEALHMASRWEIAGPPGGVRGLGDSGNIELGEKQKEELLHNLSSIATDTHALNLGGGGETNGSRPAPAPAPAPSRLPPEPAPSPAAVPPPEPAPAPAVAARPSAMARSVSAAANDQVIVKAVWFSSFHLTQN